MWLSEVSRRINAVINKTVITYGCVGGVHFPFVVDDELEVENAFRQRHAQLEALVFHVAVHLKFVFPFTETSGYVYAIGEYLGCVGLFPCEFYLNGFDGSENVFCGRGLG